MRELSGGAPPACGERSVLGGPLQPLLASFLDREEICNRNAATPTHATPVKFDSGDFMKSSGSEITRSAVRATQNGDSFDDEQRCTLSVTACYFPNLESGFAAVLATILIPVIPHTLSGYIRSYGTHRRKARVSRRC